MRFKKPVANSNLKTAVASVTLVANAFVWYLLAFFALKSLIDQINCSTEQTLLVLGLNAVAIVASAFIGSIFSSKYKNRVKFLNVWIVVGILISLTPLALNTTSFYGVIVVSLFFGAYFGVGMPGSMGYYAENTQIQNRAKIGGITFLLIGLLSSVLSAFAVESIVIACAILAAIRLAGAVLFYPLSYEERKKTDIHIKDTSFKQIVTYKPFLLYFASWCMFSLVNYLTVPIQNKLFNSEAEWLFLTSVFENVVIAVFAVIGGFLADIMGRKRLAVIGFVMIGIGYAALGLFGSQAVYFYFFADGVAWGMFYVIFLITIWGDISQNRRSDKIYFLGSVPFVMSSFMKTFFTPYLEIEPTAIFSFASVFLFLAVLPLVYAPETLPDKVLKDRDLKNYVEKAQKKVQKEKEKAKKKEKQKSGDRKDERPLRENNGEYEEALRLAEEYY
ncbi:MAG: MFS transporter [Candidatus Bathyarchaeota archaeon]|nr:MFS transporter [Candidatus Bathyarchaeota archaeon]